VELLNKLQNNFVKKLRHDLHGRRALVLGGSRWQMELIRRIKDCGIKAIVADINPNAMGRSIADEFISMDTSDKDGVIGLSKTLRIDFVITDQTDRTVPIVAAVNERLGLPGILPDVAERFTNKHSQRVALLGKGIPMPRFRKVNTPEDAIDCMKEWRCSIVVKPTTLQSSIGVFKIDRLEDVKAAFQSSLAASKGAFLLAEEFVQGVEITVESFVEDCHCHVLAVSEKEHYDYNPCVAKKLAYPPRFPDAWMNRIKHTAAIVVETLGLREGISHAEYRVKDGVPYLVEVAARGGGTGIASIIVPHISDLDIYAALIARLHNIPLPLKSFTSRSAILEFLEFHPGRVKKIHGLDQVKNSGLAKMVELQFRAGDVIAQPSDDRNRLGFCICLADDRNGAEVKVAEVKRQIKVEYI
jgi:biotin carboxylase